MPSVEKLMETGTVRRKDIARALHRRVGLSGRLCDAFVKDFFQEVADVLATGRTVNLRSLGTLEIYQGQMRVARDIRKGHPVKIPPMVRVRFVPSRGLRSSIKKQDAQ